MKFSALTAAVAVAAIGCGGGQSPKQYIGSVDTAIYASKPTSCLPTSQTPVGSDTITDFHDSLQFEVWPSADGKTTVLSVFNLTGNNSLFNVLPSNGAQVSSVFESTDGKTFVSKDVVVYLPQGSPDAATDEYTDTASASLVFTDTTYSKGTIDISTARSCTGTGCDSADVAFSCDPGAAPFIAAQIQGNNQINY